MNLSNNPLKARLLKSILLFFILVLGLQIQKSNAQDSFNRICYTDFLPEIDSDSRNKQQGPQYDITNQDIHVIPVVVHVIHGGGAANISDDLIKSQIRVLNEDFGRYGNGFNEHPDGADTEIRFCLAGRDPEGNPTDGILRINEPEATELEIENEMATKNVSRWPSDRYLNFWVVDTIKARRNVQGIIQGYSRLPGNVAGQPQDGIVMDSRFFGRKPNGNPSYELGKTTTHEVGHYLNLYHPWGPESQSGCNDDDEVDDTPRCQNPFFSTYPNPCREDPEKHRCGNGRIERMTENYMDYSADECLTIFTQGQKNRMRNAIADYRSKLVHYGNVEATGCEALYDSLNRASANEALYPDVEVYPNPPGDFIWINTFGRDERPLKARIQALNGQLIKSVDFGRIATQKTRFSLMDVSPGMYVIELDYGGKTYREKVMVR